MIIICNENTDANKIFVSSPLSVGNAPELEAHVGQKRVRNALIYGEGV